jgi:hypothetical protein
MRGDIAVNQPLKKYTVKELTAIFNTVDNVTRKKIVKHGLQTGEESVNGRLMTVVFISDNKLNEIIHEIENNKNTQKAVNAQSDTSIQPIENKSKNNDITLNDVFLFFDKHTDRLETAYKAINEAEKKVYLLEDKTKSYEDDLNFYKDEYFKFKYENEKISKEILTLSVENKKQKTYLTLSVSLIIVCALLLSGLFFTVNQIITLKNKNETPKIITVMKPQNIPPTVKTALPVKNNKLKK